MSESLASPVQRSSSLAGRRLFAFANCIIGLTSCMAIAVAAPESEPTPLTTLRNQVRDLLRQEALLDRGPEKDAAATALCDLYVILRNDSRYESSDMLRGDAAKVRRRLISVARRRENQLQREGIEKPPHLSSYVDSHLSAALTDSTQVGENSGPENLGSDPFDAESGLTAPGDSPAANSHGGRTASGIAGGQATGGQAAGGQAAGGQAAGGQAAGGQAAGGLLDNGWQLIELIQRIVAPDFWESRGGPGTIRYFALRRVLVVRATSDVHEQVRDLLRALR